SCVSNPSERLLKDYPELGPVGGSTSPFTWTKFDGDDFLVFYGESKADPSAGVGIYQGGRPTFHPPHGVTPIQGKLGVFDVSWYPLTNKDSPFYRTCLVDYQKATVQRGEKTVNYVTKRHVWAYANTEAGLNRVLAELDKVTMFASHPPDIVQ